MSRIPVVTLPKVTTPMDGRATAPAGGGGVRPAPEPPVAGPTGGGIATPIPRAASAVPIVSLPKVATPVQTRTPPDGDITELGPRGGIIERPSPQVGGNVGSAVPPVAQQGGEGVTGRIAPNSDIVVKQHAKDKPPKAGDAKVPSRDDAGAGIGLGGKMRDETASSGFAANAGNWAWIIPLAAVFLTGIWWALSNSTARTEIAGLTEKVRAESEGKVKAEVALAKLKSEADALIATQAKVRADLDAASAKLRTETEARTALEGTVASISGRLDKETKLRQELEAKIAAMPAGKGPDDTAALDALRRDLGVEKQQRAQAEQALAAFRAESEKTLSALRGDLAIETDARKKAESELPPLRQQLGLMRPATDFNSLQDQLAAEQKLRAKAEAELKDARGKVASVSAGPAELSVCRDAFRDATSSGNIEFEFGSSTLTDGSRPTLDKVAEAIRKCPWAEVRVEGHTDSRGTLERNRTVSEERARSVIDYLSKLPGVDAKRLTPIGYAHLNPVDRSGQLGADAKNRRIEFVIVLN